MNTKMWEVLGLLGIPFLPFMFMLLKNVAKAQGQGIDEGKKSDLVLAYSIVDFIKMVLVVIFFLIPFGAPLSVTSTTVKGPTCNETSFSTLPDLTRAEDTLLNDDVDINDIKITGDTGPRKSDSQIKSDNITVIGNLDPQLPIIPKLIIKMTMAASSALSSALPCPTSLETVALITKGTPLEKVSPDIQQSASDFAKQCYLPAVRRASQMTGRTPTNINENHDVTDNVFTAPGGYYDEQTISIDTKKVNELKRLKEGTQTPDVSSMTLDASNTSNYQMTCNDFYKTMTGAMIREQNVLNDGDISFQKAKNKLLKIGGYTQGEIDTIVAKDLYKKMTVFNLRSQKDNSREFGGIAGQYEDKAGSGYSITVGGIAKISGDEILSGVSLIGASASALMSSAEQRAQRMVVPLYFHVLLFVALLLSPAIITISGYKAEAIGGIIAALIVGSTAGLVSALNGFLIELLARMIEGQGGFSLDSSLHKVMVLNFANNISVILPVMWGILFGYIGYSGAASAGAAIGSVKGAASAGFNIITKLATKGVKGAK
ncbi:hypothetical protein [Photobacterium kishitanii]|nr:hypothetical protein [Photobacterium kishitanii]